MRFCDVYGIYWSFRPDFLSCCISVVVRTCGYYSKTVPHGT